MKVSHEDCIAALNFQWSCLPGSPSGRSNRSPENGRCRGKESEVCPRSRFHHAACSLGRFVYIFGGKDRYSPLRDMWAFDTLTQEWQQIENSNITIPHLQGHTMLTYKSKILIFGGTFSETSEDTPLWIYNTDLNHAHKFFIESNTVRPVGRREHSAVIYKTCMYIYGGFLDSSGSTDEFWSFSIEEEEWRSIHRRKPGKRHGHAAVIVDNRMWLHGGMKGLNPLSDLWTFSFGTNSWDKIKGLGVSPALSNHTANVVEKSIILFGGSKSGILSQDIYIFKIDTLTWRPVSTQNGDLCPPVSLHASVLLSAAVVQSSARDRSQSVPQLKKKSVISSEPKSIRPWTSPAVRTGNDEQALPSPDASFSVDILCLHTFRKDLDGNNNSSDEDIQSRSTSQSAEDETSFCSPEVNITPNESSIEQTQFKNRGQITSNWALPGVSRQLNECTRLPDLAGRQPNLTTLPPDLAVAQPNLSLKQQNLTPKQNSETGRIRSASADHCGDALPLLARFHSMNSDADLGENNFTVTLSDEEIFHPGSSEHNVCVQYNKSNQSVNLESHCKKDEERKTEFMNSTYSNNDAFSDNEFVKNKIFECSDKVGRENGQKLNKYCNTGLEAVKIKDMFKLSRHAKDNCSNKMNSYGQAGANLVNKDSRNERIYFDQTAAFIKSLSSDYKHVGKREKGIQHELNCVTDLYVEDLELCDFSEVFNNIKISSPTRPYLRSTSLTNLYSCVNYPNDCVNYPYDCVNQKLESSGIFKSQLTRSCGNLSLQNNEFHEKNLKSHKFSVGKDNFRNISYQIQPKRMSPDIKREASSGIYIKYGNVGGKHLSHFSKSARGNLYKMANSGKISVSTQTTGSQISLQNHEPNVSPGNKRSKFGHFMTDMTANTNDKRVEGLTAQMPTEELKTMNSIFNETKLCILVIGGQTENHSFYTEPLKMWKCCLY